MPNSVLANQNKANSTVLLNGKGKALIPMHQPFLHNTEEFETNSQKRDESKGESTYANY